jgi:hypothetical protein
MNFVEKINGAVDLELGKKILIFASVAALVLIPLNGLLIQLRNIKPIRSAPVLKEASQEMESESSYQTAIESSALFGGVAGGLSTPALHASLAEEMKDYRLKGVVITDDPEAIIQDARTQKSIFIKKGSQLGNLTVKEINEGWIVLTYLGEELKLEIV